MDENKEGTIEETSSGFEIHSNWRSQGNSYSFDLFTIRYEADIFVYVNVLYITVLNFEFRFYFKK